MTKLSIKHKFRLTANSKNIGIGRSSADILFLYLDGGIRDICCLIIFYTLYVFKYLCLLSI